jgi:hypothetical protein
VAVRAALEVRAKAVARRELEREALEMQRQRFEDPKEAWDGIAPILDEELARLPTRYRMPVVLCHLEGMTYDQAASQLGWTPGAVKGKLQRAMEVLRKRLTRRGVMVTGALLVWLMANKAASAAVPVSLAASTASAAGCIVAGKAVVAGLVSTQAVAVSHGIAKAALLAQMKVAAAGLVAVAAVVSGGLVVVPLVTADRPLGGIGSARVGTAPSSPAATDAADKGRAAEASKRRRVDLLALVDPARDAVRGTWTLDKEGLRSDETPRACLAIPYRPPEEYDFLVEFTYSAGCVTQLLSRGNVAFEWCMNTRGPANRLEDISGHAVIGNPTMTPYTFEPGKRYTSLVHVRKDGVSIEMNGRPSTEFKTDYSNLSRNGNWKMADDLLLGVGTWTGVAIFHRIEAVEVTGQGTIVRPKVVAADAPARAEE